MSLVLKTVPEETSNFYVSINAATSNAEVISIHEVDSYSISNVESLFYIDIVDHIEETFAFSSISTNFGSLSNYSASDHLSL